MRKRSCSGAYALFPDELHLGFKKTMAASSLSKTWLRCGEGFGSSTSLTTFRSFEKKPQAVKHLVPSLTYDAAGLSATENGIEHADITWSSTDSDLSDAEDKASDKLSHLQNPNRCGLKTDKSCNRYLLIDNKSSEGEPPLIDWDIESDDEAAGDECSQSEKAGSALEISDSDSSSSSRASPRLIEEMSQPYKAMATNISEYSSDNDRVDNEDYEDAEAAAQGKMQKPALTGREALRQSSKRLASDWLRSAEVLLQTPQKQANKTSKTPEDSAKKRKKFLRGGLAERLNRLQNRERSAVSFWRHQYVSNCITFSGDRPGVLKLRIVTLHEECSMQVAVCQQLVSLPADTSSDAENKFMVLLTKETAALLKVAPWDIIYIYPPWRREVGSKENCGTHPNISSGYSGRRQNKDLSRLFKTSGLRQKLILHDESIPVIMNTYFCQKIISQENVEMKDRTQCPEKLLVARKIPTSLAQIFNLNSTKDRANQESAVNQADCINMRIPRTAFTEDNQGKQISFQTVSDSLLEAVETQGIAGWKGVFVRVVVQRVYCLPSRDICGGRLQRIDFVATTSLPSVRLCLLVQDAYGIFSELQLPSPRYHAEDLERCSRSWEGKVCCLSGMKILQRTTRGRSPGLFSLIHSLWPPPVPLKVHGQSQDREEQVKMTLPPPSFCYVLGAHSDQECVEVEEAVQVSDLYLPPIMQHLKEILQVVGLSHRCSFCATVLYQKQAKSTIPSGQQELWLFITCADLQANPEGGLGGPRVVPVCVTASCVLDRAVTQALAFSLPCLVYFKDALRENGRIICIERTVLSLQKPLLCGTAAVDLSELTGPVKLDELDSTTQTNSVCCVQGTVIGVDESTAFSWPVCERCSSQNLERCDQERGSFHCNLCSRVVISPILRMHLEVFLHCPSRPQCTVKVKLLEKTISYLLRFCACEDGNYEVKSVLGKKVELHCYVHTVTSRPSSCIELEEISLLGAANVN
ncbi:DNA repair-scaffolding protein isoform X3 [Rhinatrema bivittatum]|uniref:DNA repair-scaffolding protein isoform X3 n=1 Tax=Rhinatrema bivittatum TaxID=194408 RepID=UPI001128E302|nr:DNA repair-scaffolding protein isoform X3 [Rhinatrema bivittatum]